MRKKLQITLVDRPNSVETALDKILAEIKSKGLKVAFFNLGQKVKSNTNVTKKIADAGHILGHHSCDHLMPATSGFTDDQIEKQFFDTHTEVIRVTARVMKQCWALCGKQISLMSGPLTGTGNLYLFSHCDWSGGPYAYLHLDSLRRSNGDACSLLPLRTTMAELYGWSCGKSRDSPRRLAQFATH